MKKLLKKAKKENGQAVVEFALVLPVFLLILCGIMDFGWFFYGKLALQNCTREGARYAIVNSENANLNTLARTKVTGLATPNIKDNLNIVITFSNPANKAAGDVTVTVDSKIKSLTPFGGIFFENHELDVSSSITMKVD